MSETTDRGVAERAAPPPHSRSAELFVFLVLAILIWPVLAAVFVGAYGFAVWVWQVLFGPPGPAG